jgi:PAS domain S-box-containing protein
MYGSPYSWHEFFNNFDWATVLAWFFSVAGGGILIWMKKRFAGWKKFWHSVSDGLRSIPSLRDDVKGIRYYVAPNGGGSLMDSVKRTENAVAQLGESLDLMNQTMWVENDSEENVGRFHASPDGAVTYVNQQLARWLGVGKDELMGWNFLNFVPSNERDKAREVWDEVRKDSRQLRTSYSLLSATGELFKVNVVATPIPDKPPVKRWVGTIKRVDDHSNRGDHNG